MRALYISFHGSPGASEYNNLHVFDLGGNWLGTAIDEDTLPSWVTLRQLRGFSLGPDGLLYVANAYKKDSNIVRFEPAGDHTWRYESVFVQGKTAKNPGVFHPYDLKFGPDGDLYVSSQNTHIVSRYAGPGSSTPGSPRKTLVDGFPPGTFASLLPDPDFQTGRFRIRGLTFDKVGNLYAANGKDGVEVFDPTGQHALTIRSADGVEIDRPIQVRFDDAGLLYIGSAGNNAVVTYERRKLRYLTGPDGAGLKKVSGLGFDALGSLYVGSRKGYRVLRYDLPDTWPVVLIDDLGDTPQFLEIFSTQGTR